MKAIWNKKIIAESAETVVVDNNHYFPASSLNAAYFVPSNTKTVCGWKGEASYYNVCVDGQKNEDAAWYYPEPKTAADNIKGYVAFWKGVQVSND